MKVAFGCDHAGWPLRERILAELRARGENVIDCGPAEPVPGDDYPDVVKRALGRLGPDSYELVTVYRGEQASDDELARLESEIRSNYPRLEVEVQQGGQQHYPFILSVE